MELTNNDIAISINNLSLSYDNEKIFDNISLKIPSGKLIGILGSNGAGKSSLIKSILGQVKINNGDIKVNRIYSYKNKLNIAYIPQRANIDWNFPINVEKVVLMGKTIYKNLISSYTKKDKEDAIEAIKKVDLLNYKGEKISNLSGGQQQRVFIARALLQNASLLVLDEPFSGVDVVSQELIITILKEMVNEGKTVIMVHHDLQTVEKYFSWVIMVNKGVVANAPLREAFTEDNIRKTFYINNYVK